jgi:hypothetical protein
MVLSSVCQRPPCSDAEAGGVALEQVDHRVELAHRAWAGHQEILAAQRLPVRPQHVL